MVQIGSVKLSGPRLGLGTAPLGGLFSAVTDEDASEVVRCAYSGGIRLFDTAPLYGYGVAERRLGAVLRSYPRRELVVSTKVGRLLRKDAPIDSALYMDGKPYFKNTEPVNPVFDFSYDGTMRSIEESLQRLGLDRIDIALIHDPDDHFSEALRGAYRALDKLRSEGTVGAIGVGTNHVAPLVNFARVAKFDCFLLAGRYTLLDQSGLSALLPLCQELGIAVILGGVFNSGILARPDSSAPYDYRPPDDFVRARVQRLSEICRSFAVTLPAAALQFPLGHPAVAAVVVGCRSASEVEENLAAFSAKVPAGVWDEIRASDLVDPLAPYPS